MVDLKDIYKLKDKINEEMKTTKPMGTGLIGEVMIISAYKTMEIKQLEGLRFIINKIIREKKIRKKIMESQKNKMNVN